jgi:hypothetical protein
MVTLLVKVAVSAPGTPEEGSPADGAENGGMERAGPLDSAAGHRY